MKFTIITPVYNGEKHLKETIESVLNQEGDFEIEYIIRDGGSKDKTIEIIKSYESKLNSGEFKPSCKKISFIWSSEKDNGMYDAINKGFEKATGDIYAWMNSDDYYLPNALKNISTYFEKNKNVSWLKGEGYLLDDKTGLKEKIPHMDFKRNLIRTGIYGTLKKFIPQETVFWKAELWKKVGGIDSNLKLAGDYSLWIKMAKYEPLKSIDSDISVFRISDTQLTNNMNKYREEQKKIRPKIMFLLYGLPIVILNKIKGK